MDSIEILQQSLNPEGKLQITHNPDGSYTRYNLDPRAPATGDRIPPGSTDPALSKDVPLNKTHSTFIRIFRPISTAPNSKLPVILYFHGGAFIFYSAASQVFHTSCAQMAAELPALVLSVEYRKAPEHRLPAAYDDATEALIWVRDQALETTEKWLDQADFSNLFIMGNSSGGNIGFHLTIRALKLDLNPIKINGLILDQPGLCGEERTESELKMVNDKILPLTMVDKIYELSLPEGASRDHEYSNLLKFKGQVRGLPRCLISGYLGDPLIDRQRAFVEMFEEEGVSIVSKLDQEGFHGIALLIPEKAAILRDLVKQFVCGSLN